MTELYPERFMNHGLTPAELRSGRPTIGIVRTGNDRSSCSRVHVELVPRVRDGIRDGGGVAMEFPVHSIFENCRRPTAALDRNLAYLGLIEMAEIARRRAGVRDQISRDRGQDAAAQPLTTGSGGRRPSATRTNSRASSVSREGKR